MKKRTLKTLLASTLVMANLSFAGTIQSDIGKGILLYDKEAGLKDRCISLESNEVFAEDVKQTIYTLDLVTNREELHDKITIKSSASGSYGIFSADAKMKFVKEVNWNFNSSYVLVKATRLTRKLSISKNNILLTNYAKNLLLDSKFRFLESCGNSFAHSVILGGEVYGLLEIVSDTYEQKQQLEVSLKGKGGNLSGKVQGSASYSRTIREIESQYKVKISFQHIGGKQIEAPNTVEGLLKLSNSVEELTDVNPVPIAIETRDYTTVSNYVLDNDNYETRIRQDSIDWAESKLKDARNKYSQLLYVLENARDFRNFNETTLKNNLAYLDSKIIELKAFIAKSYSFLNESDISKISINLDIDIPEMKWRAARKNLKYTCETKRSQLCGVETYRKQKSSACGVVGPNEGSGPVCGTIFKEAATENCGIKQYKVKASSACGVALWRQCHSSSCGKNWDGSRKRCRTKACGAEAYNSCAHPSHGAQEFNFCRHEKHGIEKYNTCKSKEFGYEFESCQHLSHGPEQFNICDVAKIGSQETFCPEF